MLPIISVNIITWNSEKKIKACLKSLIKQNYPKTKLEVIVVDGGSQDKTLKLVKDFAPYFGKLKIIKTQILDQEPKRAIAALKSTGKYICSLDPDVRLVGANWLRTMIEPMEANKEIFISQTLYYHHTFQETWLNRYFALFGVNDPVAFYLHKADRIPHYENRWLFPVKNIVDHPRYFHLFLGHEIPTMGCNGVMLRRSIYNKAIGKPEQFFHIDVIQDLVLKGNNQAAIVKNSVWHSTSATFWDSLTKRIKYMKLHFYEKKAERRYLVFDANSKQDRLNILKFMIFTFTIVQPVYLSIKGFIKKPDPAWFLHYPMCLLFLISYTLAVVNKKLSS